MSGNAHTIRALSRSTTRLSPPARVTERAAIDDPVAWYGEWEQAPDTFWEKAAHELHWFAPWNAVSHIVGGEHAWFIGGQTNLSFNCLERNIERGLGAKTALHYESENGDVSSYSYAEVLAQVSRVANGLASIGVARGDRVVIYMPLGPEGIFTMHACVRIGAIHSVVYAGMGAQALRQRIEDSGAKVVVCSDVTYRRGKCVALKYIVDEAVAGSDGVEHVVVHRRDSATRLTAGQTDFSALTAGLSATCDAERMDAEDVAFTLYTSGTTDAPKGVVHVHGGYAVGVHMLMRNYFDTGQDDVWWSTSDIGWIVGHSYIAYGPMLVGATQVIREGTPDYPDAGITWRLVDKYQVTTMFTAPTAVRMFMRMGEAALAGSSRESLRVLYCAGEPFNPEAWLWAQKHLVKEGQVVDNYWQTEIASPMLGTFPSMDARPGFAGRPIPGVELAVVDDEGNQVGAGVGGLLVMRRPVPWMMRTVWGDPARYAAYWSKKLGGYVTGDIAVCDAEGYWAVLGRSDDVLNVAGHRIGTADVESSLITHPAVAESAVIGISDEIKGEAIKAFVVLRPGMADPSDRLAAELKAHVRAGLGPIAQPAEIAFLDALPKTRSGKIMRRLLKARELGEDEGDTSTLDK